MATQLTAEQLQQIASLTPGQTVNIGGTLYQPMFSEQGAGESMQVGPLERIIAYDPSKTGIGESYNIFSPTGSFSGTGQFKKVDSNILPFLAGSALLFGGLGGLMGNGIFGSLGSGAGSGAFLGEGVATGIPAWDAAYGGALLEGGAGLGAAGTAANTASGVSKFLSNIPGNITSNLVSGLLTAGLANNIAGGGANTGVGGIPTQGIPVNTPEYYTQVQNFLNQYVPGQMPTQAQYLANWYGSQPGMMTPATDVVTDATKAVSAVPTTTILPTTATTTTLPTSTVTKTAITSPLTAQQAADYYRSTVGRGLMSERDLVTELRAIGVPDSIMTQAQGLLSSGSAAPVYDKTYTATDIRDAIQQTLKTDPNVRKEDLKILAATTYGVDPFEFDRQWTEVAGNRFIDKYANTTDPIIKELVNNMRETQQIYETSSNAAAVNAAQNAAMAADLANPNFNATPADIAAAYQQSVGAGTMTETDFVNRALAMGASVSDLQAAQNILLGR